MSYRDPQPKRGPEPKTTNSKPEQLAVKRQFAQKKKSLDLTPCTPNHKQRGLQDRKKELEKESSKPLKISNPYKPRPQKTTISKTSKDLKSLSVISPDPHAQKQEDLQDREQELQDRQQELERCKAALLEANTATNGLQATPPLGVRV